METSLELLEKIYNEKVKKLEDQLSETNKIVETLTTEKTQLETKNAEIVDNYSKAQDELKIVARRAELMEQLASGSLNKDNNNIVELKKTIEDQGEWDLSIKDFIIN